MPFSPACGSAAAEILCCSRFRSKRPGRNLADGEEDGKNRGGSSRCRIVSQCRGFTSFSAASGFLPVGIAGLKLQEVGEIQRRGYPPGHAAMCKH